MPRADYPRVTHPFAAFPGPEGPVLARLACVKRAASARPEPGSNSPRRSVRLPKEAGFRHLELVLKVSPEGDDRFVRFLAGSQKPPPRSRRKRTLLSFQRPRRFLVRPVKKPPTRARGLQITGTCVVSECVRRRSSFRVAGTFLRAALGQPGNDSSAPPPVKRSENA